MLRTAWRGAREPPCRRCQPAGRPLPQGSKGRGGGKSGLHRHTVPDNARRGRPQGKCHRERTAFPARKGEDGKGEKVR